MSDRVRGEGRPSDQSRDIHTAARRLGAPPAPTGLVARVVAERRAGLRAAIPDGEPLPAPSPVRSHTIAAAAAMLILGLVALNRWRARNDTAAHEVAQGACEMNTDAPGLLMAGALLLATACAQEPSSMPSEPAPPVRALAEGGPREGTWVYHVGRQGGTTAYEAWHTFRRIDSGDAAGWRSVNLQQNVNASGPGWQGQARIDTLYYASDGLTPLQQMGHTVRGGRERWALQVTFGIDSVHVISDYRGYGDVPPQRRTAATALPTDGVPMVPVAYDPGLAILLQQLPLTAGWSGSFQMGPFGDGWFRQESLHVDGEETIEVPAGVFDCWRLTMTPPFPPYPYRLWVSKEGQLLVRSVLGPEGHGTERALVSFTP